MNIIDENPSLYDIYKALIVVFDILFQMNTCIQTMSNLDVYQCECNVQ